MGNINFESIALMVIGTVIVSTKAQVDAQVDKAGDAIVAAIKNSETQIDDVVGKDLLAPALRRLADRITSGLSA